jgi:hypothetical protein
MQSAFSIFCTLNINTINSFITRTVINTSYTIITNNCLGARSKSGAKKNAISLSAKDGPATLGLFTSGNNAHSTNVNASAKVKGVAIKAIVNPKTFTNLSHHHYE